MSKHEIDIPELPEGWKPVAYRIPEVGEYYEHRGQAFLCENKAAELFSLIIVRIQPLRIVLQEIPISKAKIGCYMNHRSSHTLIPVGSQSHDDTYTFWSVVKETDLSLTELSLSVDDCKAITYHLSDEIDNSIYEKLDKFIKDNA